LNGVDEIVLSLYAHGLSTGEISALFASIYGASVSKETISRITDKVVEEMTEEANRLLDGVYAEVFIDAIMVKVRDGLVANRPIYAAIGVSLAGGKDVLGRTGTIPRQSVRSSDAGLAAGERSLSEHSSDTGVQLNWAKPCCVVRGCAPMAVKSPPTSSFVVWLSSAHTPLTLLGLGAQESRAAVVASTPRSL
jgi:hypothetical protein